MLLINLYFEYSSFICLSSCKIGKFWLMILKTSGFFGLNVEINGMIFSRTLSFIILSVCRLRSIAFCMPVSITLCGYFCFLRNFSNSANHFVKVMPSDTIVLILRARQKGMLVLV